MKIKTVTDIDTIADDNSYGAIIQEKESSKNIMICYNPETETLIINEQDYAMVKDLPENQLIELEHHIISCNNDKNVIYGIVECDASELRIFNSDALGI